MTNEEWEQALAWAEYNAQQQARPWHVKAWEVTWGTVCGLAIMVWVWLRVALVAGLIYGVLGLHWGALARVDPAAGRLGAVRARRWGLQPDGRHRLRLTDRQDAPPPPDDLLGGYLAVHAAADAALRDVRRWAVCDLIRGPARRPPPTHPSPAAPLLLVHAWLFAAITDGELDAAAQAHEAQARQLRDPAIRRALRGAWQVAAPLRFVPATGGQPRPGATCWPSPLRPGRSGPGRAGRGWPRLGRDRLASAVSYYFAVGDPRAFPAGRNARDPRWLRTPGGSVPSRSGAGSPTFPLPVPSDQTAPGCVSSPRLFPSASLSL